MVFKCDNAVPPKVHLCHKLFTGFPMFLVYIVILSHLIITIDLYDVNVIENRRVNQEWTNLETYFNRILAILLHG